MAEILAFLFCSAAFAMAGAVLTWRQMHIFQLNSYKPKVQLEWIKRDADGLLRRAISVLTVPFILLFDALGAVISASIFLVVFFLSLPKPAKKPLVVTGRVKRMFTVIGFLYVLYMALSAVCLFARSINYVFALYGVITILNPYTVILANFLLRPTENRINNGFIRDAERIISEMPRLTVIGVTGSYGKTSVKFYLGKLLSAKYNVLVTPESYNTTLGVVRTVREHLRPTHDIFVCEMGAKGLGEIKEICDIVHPRMGVITSIGPQHLESFGSIENIIKTKFELEEALPEGGTIFLNTDNKYIADRTVAARKISYGIESGEYRARDIRVSEQGSEFKLTGRDGTEYSFVTRLIGRHNVQNIAGAIAVADTLGVPMEDIVMQVRRLEGVPHRLQLIRRGKDLLIDDAYNSNPSGAKAALDTLNEISGLKVLVTPGMIELGEKQYELNFEFGRQAAEVCDFVALVGSRQTRPIYEGLMAAGFDKEKLFLGDTLQSALAAVDGIETAERKVILLENDLPDNY